jgi:hypothetical protein
MDASAGVNEVRVEPDVVGGALSSLGLDWPSGAGAAAWRSVRRNSGLALDGRTIWPDPVGRRNGHRDTFVPEKRGETAAEIALGVRHCLWSNLSS